MAFTIKKVVYCRGCNREVQVDERVGDSYVERTARSTQYHPIVDCDERESG